MEPIRAARPSSAECLPDQQGAHASSTLRTPGEKVVDIIKPSSWSLSFQALKPAFLPISRLLQVNLLHSTPICTWSRSGSYVYHGSREGFSSGLSVFELCHSSFTRQLQIVLREEESITSTQSRHSGQHRARGSTRCLPYELYFHWSSGGPHKSLQYIALVPSLSCLLYGVARASSIYFCSIIRHQ